MKGREIMNRLKELRKEKGLTQQGLADEIGITKRTYIYWEQGERQIKPDKAEKLANFFGVSVGYLLGYSEYNNSQELIKKIHSDNSPDIAWKISGIVSMLGEKVLDNIREVYGDGVYLALINLIGELSFHDAESETICKFLALDADFKEIVQEVTVKLFDKQAR